MTEQEWLACADPQTMLWFLRDKASDRKLRWFGVACCRRIWHLLPQADVGCEKAIEVTEQFADGAVTQTLPTNDMEVVTAAVASSAVFAAAASASTDDAEALAAHAVYAASSLTGTGYADEAAIVWSVAADASAADDGNHSLAERQAQSHLLREIFSNPFRPMAADPSWRTSNVVSLATNIYDERAFDRLPILADALEDAGCTSADILNHCRQPGEHVRGCWVVDLVFGKS